jgi:hypothetical protein
MILGFCVPNDNDQTHFRQSTFKNLLVLNRGAETMSDWTGILSPYKREHAVLADALARWRSLRGGKTRNVDIIWFPKPITNLTDMRNKLKVAYEHQTKRLRGGEEGYFVENEVAEELARRGAFTRPATDSEELLEQYEEETTPNKPHISSFRMQNRLFRFLGWTTRRVGHSNQYVVTDIGSQMTKFGGDFPSSIGLLSERELVIRSLVNFGVFSVNDHIRQWDTRFKQRVAVNLLRVISEYGYASNYELVVTTFALKDERDSNQLEEMTSRLRSLHDGTITMVDAFKQVNVNPYNSSAVNNAYDNPKVLLSLCRQAGLLFHKSFSLEATPFGDLRAIYAMMHKESSEIKMPRVVNVITDYGREVLARELEKQVIWFDELQ